MSTETISIIGWKDFQHYHDRNPPWIKLHTKILDNYAFSTLADTTKGVLFCLWALAARHDNAIPRDVQWIRARIGYSSKTDLGKALQDLADAGFITLGQAASTPLATCSNASDTLADRQHDASRKKEAETETEKDKHSLSPRARERPESVVDVIAYATEIGLDAEEAEKMFDYYESNGWRVGNKPMKDWQAALRNWKRKAQEYRPHGRPSANGTPANGTTIGKRNYVPTAESILETADRVSDRLGIR